MEDYKKELFIISMNNKRSAFEKLIVVSNTHCFT
jgi:hypothetical protein